MSNPFIEGFLDEFIKVGGGMMRALRIEKSLAKTLAKKKLLHAGGLMSNPAVAAQAKALNKREMGLRRAGGIAEERAARSVAARQGRPGLYPDVKMTDRTVPLDNSGLRYGRVPLESEASAIQRRAGVRQSSANIVAREGSRQRALAMRPVEPDGFEMPDSSPYKW